MLVVTEREAAHTARLLVDELDLLGFTSELEFGRQENAEAAHERHRYRAVVWLHHEHQARIWLPDEATPHDVARSDSDQLAALRTAEALRGRLLPGGEARRPENDSQPDDSDANELHRFELFGGPGIIISSYAEPLPSFSLGLAYRPLSQISVGFFAAGSLVRNAWQSDPEQLTASQISLGARVAYRWLNPPGGPLHSDLLLRGSFRNLSIRDEGGPMERGSATLWGPTVDLGIGGTYELTPWFGLGLETCLIVGFPLARSANLDNGMAPREDAPLVIASESAGVDLQLATSFLAIASW